MNIVIGSPVIPPNNHEPNSFLIECRTMIGDADGYSDDLVFGYFPNTDEGKEYLYRCIKFLNLILGLATEHRALDGIEQSINRFDKKQEEITRLLAYLKEKPDLVYAERTQREVESQEKYKSYIDTLRDIKLEFDYWTSWDSENPYCSCEWPRCPDGSGYDQSLNTYTVYYFDENKSRHSVTIDS